MGQQEYDNFKRLIKEWLDSHPDEYADFVEEMNDKKFKGPKGGHLSDIRPPEIEIKKEIDIELEKEGELKGQALARSYGRYENVFLTDTELSELQAELPEKWAYYIERLSGYIASTGKKYKNHAATIRRWAADDTAKAAPKQGIPEYTCKEGESL